MRHASAIATIAVLAAAAPRARADGPVEAELLFQDGRRLLAAGQTAEACDKFDASARIEPTVGALFDAAACREKNQQLATAWATFLEAASLANREGNDARRMAAARNRAALLESRLSYLVVSVPDASKVDGLEIRRGGVVVDPALWNQGVPIDDGAYDVSASAPGRQPWSTHVEVTGLGTRAVVEVPRFKPLAPMPRHDDEDPTASPPPLRAVAPVAASPNDPFPAAPPPHRLTRTRELALGIAALGAASIAGGVVLGVRARNFEAASDAICPDPMQCNDADALAYNHTARREAVAADVFLIGGGAAIAGAAVLWLAVAPATHARDVVATPVVTPSSVGFAVSGRF